MWACTLGWSIVSRRVLACQYGSREELAIMVARQAKPIDTSSPDFVVRPLWQAMHRSDVWNEGCVFFLPPATAVTANSVRRQHERTFISSPRSTGRPANPKADRTLTASDDFRCLWPVFEVPC